MSETPLSAVDLLALDGLLSEEEREIRSTVRRWLAEHVRPHVADWFERGEIPARELAQGLGELGVLGMHLEGYGCAGTSARRTAWPASSSRPSTPGSARSCRCRARWRCSRSTTYGSEEQKRRVAAPHGRRRGDRLLRPHRAGLRLQPVGHAHPGQARRRRLGAQRHQDVDHQRLGRRRRRRLGADRRRHPGLRRPDRHARASRRPRSHRSCRCAPR